MAMTVNFESPPGVADFDYIFAPDSFVRILLHVSRSWAFNSPIAYLPCYMVMSGDLNLSVSALTDGNGDAIIDFQLPNLSAQAVLTFWHDYVAFTGDDKQQYVIGVGMLPGPVPGPQPNPITSAAEALKYVGMAGMVIAGLYLVSKVIPQRRQ